MKKTRKVDKREQHIKKKLTAAILMLLISSIMTVTSTYAWFTLSTAPEVTGIQTTIGGNGNLEIALANETTWLRGRAYEYEEFDKIADTNKDINTSYGNLVDLSDVTRYGFDSIVLYPAKLNYTDPAQTKVNPQVLLCTPTYETDGRISGVSANTEAGVFDGNGFATSGNGVRAIGASSSTSERMFAYRNALNGISSYKGLASEAVTQAISDHGDHLANIAVEFALNGNDGTYKYADLKGLQDMIADTHEGVEKVENSIINIIKAAIASKEIQKTFEDEKYNLVLSTINSLKYDDLTVIEDTANSTTDGEGVKQIAISEIKVTLGSDEIRITNDYILNLVEKYLYVDSKLTVAANAANIAQKETYTWGEISPALKHLMDTESSNVMVAGESLQDLRAGSRDDAVNAVMKDVLDGGDVSVDLGSGSSVFYNIAELVGNISSKVNTSINAMGIDVDNMIIVISTVGVNSALIDQASNGVKLLGEPDLVGTATSKIDDIYAFAIDFFVRTNASGSKLLLQIDPTQRIYDSSSNPDTMGNGTSMTFTSSSMTELEMVNLLENVRVVFISGDTNSDGTILAEGRLDVRNTTNEAKEITSRNYIVNASGGIVADIKLWDEVALGTPTTSETNETYDPSKSYETEISRTVDNSTGEITTTTITYTVNEDQTSVKTTTKVQKSKFGFIEDETAQVIMSLDRGFEHKITTVVYLDGTTVSNADVSSFATSMTGTMNLQFASDADLVPMDYSGLSESGLIKELDPASFTYTPASTEDPAVAESLTVGKVENAVKYTYSINGGNAVEFTFATDASTFAIPIDENTTTVTVVATPSDDDATHKPSTSTWTKPTN